MRPGLAISLALLVACLYGGRSTEYRGRLDKMKPAWGGGIVDGTSLLGWHFLIRRSLLELSKHGDKLWCDRRGASNESPWNEEPRLVWCHIEPVNGGRLPG